MADAKKIFISYRRGDLGGHAAAMVGRIFDRLEARFGRGNVFMDVDAIPPGVDFAAFIDSEVCKANIILAIVGPQWVKLMKQRAKDPVDYLRIEIESGMRAGIPIVPVLIGGASVPGTRSLPKSLQGFGQLNAAPVDSGRDFHVHMGRLIEGIERLFDEEEDGEPGPGSAEEPGTGTEESLVGDQPASSKVASRTEVPTASEGDVVLTKKNKVPSPGHSENGGDYAEETLEACKRSMRLAPLLIAAGALVVIGGSSWWAFEEGYFSSRSSRASGEPKPSGLSARPPAPVASSGYQITGRQLGKELLVEKDGRSMRVWVAGDWYNADRRIKIQTSVGAIAEELGPFSTQKELGDALQRPMTDVWRDAHGATELGAQIWDRFRPPSG